MCYGIMKILTNGGTTMHEIKIYLRNGNLIETATDKLTVKRNDLGQVIDIAWENIPDEYPVPLHIDLTEIIAITSRRMEFGSE